jgi:protein-S-isoprenylcysteine O-methyltransferase Ste14
MIMYFGMGAVADSTITGVTMFGLALILGTLYHRLIEEKELKRRFGAEYEEYRRRTPFLLPRFVRHSSNEDPNQHIYRTS